jgi:hypothetical protein
MLPAPARIAAAPSPKSRACWNPAVPPPPVGGAAVGNGLGAGLCVADGDGEALTDGLAEALGDGLADGLAEALGDGLALAVGELAEGVSLAEEVDVAGAVMAGEDVGSDAEGEDVVQAEIAAEASMVTMPQPTALNLGLSPAPAAVVRTFIEPPRASGRWRPRFPVPHQKPASDRKTCRRPHPCPRRLKAGPRKRRGP